MPPVPMPSDIALHEKDTTAVMLIDILRRRDHARRVVKPVWEA